MARRQTIIIDVTVQEKAKALHQAITVMQYETLSDWVKYKLFETGNPEVETKKLKDGNSKLQADYKALEAELKKYKDGYVKQQGDIKALQSDNKLQETEAAKQRKEIEALQAKTCVAPGDIFLRLSPAELKFVNESLLPTFKKKIEYLSPLDTTSLADFLPKNLLAIAQKTERYFNDDWLKTNATFWANLKAKFV